MGFVNEQFNYMTEVIYTYSVRLWRYATVRHTDTFIDGDALDKCYKFRIREKPTTWHETGNYTLIRRQWAFSFSTSPAVSEWLQEFFFYKNKRKYYYMYDINYNIKSIQTENWTDQLDRKIVETKIKINFNQCPRQLRDSNVHRWPYEACISSK
jgi:hypothetical protein